MIRTAMQQKGMSQYRLSKNSGIPYTTINDICNNRVKLEKCSAETVYRISQALDISMEKLLEQYRLHRSGIGIFWAVFYAFVHQLPPKNFL